MNRSCPSSPNMYVYVCCYTLILTCTYMFVNTVFTPFTFFMYTFSKKLLRQNTTKLLILSRFHHLYFYLTKISPYINGWLNLSVRVSTASQPLTHFEGRAVKGWVCYYFSLLKLTFTCSKS